MAGMKRIKELRNMDHEERENLMNSPRFQQFKQDREDEFREAFKLLDTNNDDTITNDELGRALQIVGQNPTAQEIRDYIEFLDHNKTGKIEFEEFVFLMFLVFKDPEELKNILLDAFRVFDKDGNHFIDAAEFRQVVCQFGDALKEEELKEMMAIADTNKDGRIDYTEFCAMITDDST